MATTTNYSWTTPDDTALVKDGAAAIRTLGSSVDTTTKNLNPSTTLGDIEYRSSTANTNTRLGIGSTGQILTVAGGVPTWATPSGAANFGKNNKENWGKIIDDTKTALTVLKIQRDNYNAAEAAKQQEHEAEILKQNQDAYNKRLEKFRKYKAQRHLEAEKARNELKATEIETVASGPRQGIKTIDPAPIDIKAPQKLEHTFTQIDYAMQNQIAKQEEYEERFAKSMEGVNQAFNNLTADGLEAFGVLLGDIMTGQIGSFQDFGKKLLGAVAAFMKSFGQALIATATASKAFKELLIKNPVLAAAAGVALIAGSAVITNMLNKGPQATAFAEGGIVSGPTLGLVGEYPGASSNPEVIAPLDKLKGMLNTNEQSGFVASTTIQGRDLAIVLERYNKDSRRG